MQKIKIFQKQSSLEKDGVSDVLSTINQVTTHKKLIALNPSIEAVRLGETGLFCGDRKSPKTRRAERWSNFRD